MTNEERVEKLNAKRKKYVDDVNYYTEALAEAESKLQTFDDIAKELLEVVIDEPVVFTTTEEDQDEELKEETTLY